MGMGGDGEKWVKMVMKRMMVIQVEKKMMMKWVDEDGDKMDR